MTVIANLNEANPPRPTGKFAVTIAAYLRPNDTTLYTTGDVVSNSTGVERTIGFLNCGQSGNILRAQITVEENDAQTFELFVFDEEPTNFLDNVALALAPASMTKLVGVFDFAAGDAKILSTAGAGILLYPQAAGAVRTNAYTSRDKSRLFGLLVVRSAWTPAASTTIRIRLDLEHD